MREGLREWREGLMGGGEGGRGKEERTEREREREKGIERVKEGFIVKHV